MYSSAEPFAVQATHQDGTLLLRLTGELDIATAPKLHEAIVGLINPSLRVVTVDVEGLNFVDLAGLRELSEVGRLVVGATAEFALCAVSEFALGVIRMAQMNDLIAANERGKADIRMFRSETT